MKTRGIDVSSYQGKIDWKKTKASGVEFAILKVMRKDLAADRRFEENWRGCREAGMPVQGVYHYTYATTTEKAAADAQRILGILGGRKPMVWLDVEDPSLKRLGSKLIDVIVSYGRVIEDSGRSFGFYTGLSFYNAYIKPYRNGRLNYPAWIARYPSSKVMNITESPDEKKKPSVWRLAGWQYTSKGSVAGITGHVDLDELYIAVETDNITQTQTDGGAHHTAGEQGAASSQHASGTTQREYTVKSGDTLSAIARRYQTTVNAIVKKNKEKYPRITADYIMVGWRLAV